MLAAAFAGLRTNTFNLFAAQEYESEIEGYGRLVEDPAGVLDLPEGFHYHVLSRTGDFMRDGLRIPGAPDGMAAFQGAGDKVILVRNHELSRDSIFASPYGVDGGLKSKIDLSKIYDLADGVLPHIGGTTNLVYDPVRRKVIRQFMSLAGTCRNCAGGPTPWNTWITCEETLEKAGRINREDHGYCFEVPAVARPTLADPVPLKAMGRFNHEAVAVDPLSRVVYETEDRPDSLFYRFIPNVPGQLAQGGRLQALAIAGEDGCDTRNWDKVQIPKRSDGKFGVDFVTREKLFEKGMPREVRWVDMDEVESPKDDLRYRGFHDGGAVFARGEGAWFGNDSVYFACTNGGAVRKGQIFRYRPSPWEGTDREAEAPGTLELFVESPGETLLEYCDNLTVAPWGDLVISEDGPEQQYLRGVTKDGKLYTIGFNRLNDSEFAGVCFAPNHPTLFVNIQRPGITLAITGPWRNLKT